MGIVRNVLVRVGADISGMQKNLSRAKSSMNKFSAQTNSALAITKTAVVGLALAAGAAFALMSKQGVSMAMDVEASLQRLDYMFGEHKNSFIEWANTQAIAFNMSKSEALKYGAVYGNLISTMTNDQKKLTDYSIELLKASAIVASATGRQMEDVMERIRSGLLGNTEAIEDLGINIYVNLLESTEAFKKFANGKSWDQLSFQTQQQIRYFAILEQVSNKFGDSVYKNTSSSLAQFNALLKDAQLNLGQAFLPLVNTVMPILTNFAKELVRVTEIFKQFMQALFGVNSNQTQNASSASAAAKAQANLGNATKKAGDKAKRGVAGFDEINQLQESIAANAEDAAAAMSAETTTTPKKQDDKSILPPGVTDAIDQLKKSFAPSLGELKTAFEDLKKSASDLWKTLEPYLRPAGEFIFSKISKAAEGLAKGGIYALSGGLKILSGSIKIVDGLISGDFLKTLGGLETAADGAWQIIKGGLVAVFPDLEDKLNSAEKKFKETWSKFKEHVKTYGDPAKLEASDFVLYFQDKFAELKTSISTKWDEIKTATVNKLAELKVGASTKWDEIKTATANKLAELKTGASTKWDEIKKAVGTKLDETKTNIGTAWSNIKANAGTKWDEIKSTISEKWNLIKQIRWEDVRGNISKVWDGLKKDTNTIWSQIATNIKNTIKDSINTVIGFVNGFIQKINNIKVSIPPVTVAGKKVFDGASIGFPKIPEIPKLANGVITGINKPFLAQVGDNKTQPEVIAPLGDLTDMIASAVSNAMLQVLQFNQSTTQQQQSGEAIFQVDGTQLARVLIPIINREQERTGRTTIIQTI